MMEGPATNLSRGPCFGCFRAPESPALLFHPDPADIAPDSTGVPPRSRSPSGEADRIGYRGTIPVANPEQFGVPTPRW